MNSEGKTSKRVVFGSTTAHQTGFTMSETCVQITQKKIPTTDFSKDPNIKQYVYLQAEFPDRLLEKIVLLSFQTGYIFIQTDKNIYTPNSMVHYQIFAVRPNMEPVESGNDSQTDDRLDIEIVTADGFTVHSETVKLTSGIFSGSYFLSNMAITGQWELMGNFHISPQQKFSERFSVKEYVLSSFDVKLTPVSSFFYVDSKAFIVNITATYIFDKSVDGTAYVVFGVMHEGKKNRFPSSLQTVPIKQGNGAVTLKREHITQTFPNIFTLVGSSIFLFVNVLTENGGEMMEAELKHIKITSSPYTIHFKSTPKYFKQGMSFDVVVEVLNADDTGAPGVPVVVDPGAVRGITAANGLAKISINTAASLQTLTITARTDDPLISSARQASAIMEAHPYQSNSNSYMKISVDTAEVALGDNITVSIFLNTQEHEQRDITYLILSRGQLVQHGRYQSRNSVISSVVPITKDMLPSFRIIAYYHLDSDEVVSESVWVDVKESCFGSLKLLQSRSMSFYEPQRMFSLKIKGDPDATVGFLAVDKRSATNLLTRKKIWDIVEKYDTGCSPGGGKDGMNVFYDAGLLFQSKTFGTPSRADLKCCALKRRKRGTAPVDIKTSLVSHYKDKEQRECCLDGMRTIPVSYTCERRSEYIVDGPVCTEAFLRCCEEMERWQAHGKEGTDLLARSKRWAQDVGDVEDDAYMDREEINVRLASPKMWLWSNVKLHPCPKQNPNCDTTNYFYNSVLPTSLTTWQLTGISLSRTHGICVADPLEVIVRKQFFIDLKLPYSAVLGEQLEIKTILHNNIPDSITVRVEIKEDASVCSAAHKKKWFGQEVKVGPQTTQSVPFIIIPMKEGEVPIEIKANVKDSSLTDGIRKILHVASQGVLGKTTRSLRLNPAKKGGKQVEFINSEIPPTDLMPNTPTSTMISITGGEQLSSLFENVISGDFMGALIEQPSGCGEQNIAAMTLPVMATIYLDKTNQWGTVGVEKRSIAIQHIKTGYMNELSFRKSDGSFAIFKRKQSSTWLTAYVTKVLALAYNLILVQQNVICDAVKFLILNTQQPDGSFMEIGDVYDKTMIGDVLGVDSDASMTAFCLMAIQQSLTICSTTVNIMANSIQRAVTYLELRLPSLTNPYAVALTSCALADESKLNEEILFNFASPDQQHWPVPMGKVYTLEATAYALLALIKANAFLKAEPVAKWFGKQRRVRGAYESTQATIMVYQAVAEYWTNVKEPPYNLNVDVMIAGRSLIDKYNLNKENFQAVITSKFEDINKNITVTAVGTGEAIFNMVSLYYMMPKTQESDCEMFNLTVQFFPEKNNESERIYKLKIDVLFKNEDRNASTSVLEIGLPTGFTFNKNDLDSLSSGHASLISHYETNKALSDKGSLIIYMRKVSNKHPEEISFRIRQQLRVRILQPAAVSVYEYNNRKHCVKFYHPERHSGELLTFCKENECICAEESCSRQRKQNISNDERTEKACESTPTNKIEFVYKVRVEDFEDGLAADMYKMQILKTFKEGSLDIGTQGKPRTFLSFQHCREALDLRTGKTYLIMGPSSDIYSEGSLYQYMLGENSWIEYWPTPEECRTEEYQDTCSGIDKAVQHYETFGCHL
ncbi:complement C3-like isoform X1 [Cololabis saira]|uniref:complement C3-like isoform X1 n=1 Tax=Cololabis saira TaxID=129043 RepID=UPI002AD51713|nr:complement C3-like isoform X1 [Cololabis saira]